MKKVYVILLVVVLSMFSLKAFSSTIAVVDLGKVMSNCKAGKQAKAQISSLVAAKKVVMNNKINEIKQIAQKLKNKKLNQAMRDKETALYKDKIKEFQIYKDDVANEIREKENTLSGTIIKGIIKVIKQYAQTHKIDAVLEVGRGVNVIYWNNKLDITKTITKLYDTEYSKK